MPQTSSPQTSSPNSAVKENSQDKQIIAILGGGPSSLASAFELTSKPGWQERYEVHVYQEGWRLGGKLKTGRGPCDRIEEHGIHILQGWYDNVFRLLTEAYDERREQNLDPDALYQELMDALEPVNSTLITEWLPGRQRWASWPLIFPQNDTPPGMGPPPSIWTRIRELLQIAVDVLITAPIKTLGARDMYVTSRAGEAASTLETLIADAASLVPSVLSHLPKVGVINVVRGWFEDAEEKANTWLGAEFAEVARGLINELHQPRAEGAAHPIDVLHGILAEVLKLFDAIEADLLEAELKLRRAYIVIDLAAALLKGIAEDVWDPTTQKFDFTQVNQLDFRAWIRSHGAREITASCGLVRFFYCGTFANRCDGKNQGGLISAGIAFRFLLAVAGYKTAFVFQMKAGTGDTFTMPVYQVLKHRGVKFKFFHKVKQIHWSDSGEIERVTVERQVGLKKGVKEYDPTIRVGRITAWPAHPNYDQLSVRDAKRLQRDEIDLESPWNGWVGKDVELKLGKQFDQLILGIPVNALRTICAEFRQNPEWDAMLDGVRTTQTINGQLWFKPTTAELGFRPEAWGLKPDSGAPNSVVYANPITSWTDMSTVIENEGWPANATPGTVLYLSGAMPDAPEIPSFSDTTFPGTQLIRVQHLIEQWLRDQAGWYFPKGRTLACPQGVDENLLASDESAQTIEQKFHAQFFNPAINPSDRYTLSVPKSDVLRLKTDESGFSNLFLCGDWTDFGLNVGYVEGAVISGLRAAQALRSGVFGFDAPGDHSPIYGDDEEIA